jgi:hypothetical protein
MKQLKLSGGILTYTGEGKWLSWKHKSLTFIQRKKTLRLAKLIWYIRNSRKKQHFFKLFYLNKWNFISRNNSYLWLNISEKWSNVPIRRWFLILRLRSRPPLEPFLRSFQPGPARQTSSTTATNINTRTYFMIVLTVSRQKRECKSELFLSTLTPSGLFHSLKCVNKAGKNERKRDFSFIEISYLCNWKYLFYPSCKWTLPYYCLLYVWFRGACSKSWFVLRWM